MASTAARAIHFMSTSPPAAAKIGYMDLSYPIGKFDFKQTVTPGQYPALIAEIAAAPALFRDAVPPAPDSHRNSYVRWRLALTESEPPIRPYAQKAWAELADSRTAPVEMSLQLIEGMHARWALLLKTLSDADFGRSFRHPELGLVRLDTNLALYAWHGGHHAAHIAGLRQRNGWK